jgi:hypothetical protein
MEATAQLEAILIAFPPNGIEVAAGPVCNSRKCSLSPELPDRLLGGDRPNPRGERLGRVAKSRGVRLTLPSL